MDNYSVSEIVKIICTLSGLKKKSWAAPRNGAGLCLPVLPFRQAGVPSLPRASSGPAFAHVPRASGFPLLSLAGSHKHINCTSYFHNPVK